MKKKIFLVLLLCPLSLYAHVEIMDSIDNNSHTAPYHVADPPVSADSLLATAASQSQYIQSLVDSLNFLKEVTIDYEKKIRSLENKLKRQERKLIFADSIVARVSNDCLRKKYDPIRVHEAIRNFKNMYSPELQNKFRPLLELLNNYERYNREIVGVFEEAKNDKKFNFFMGQQQAKIYIDKIKSTNYYREVYDANWTIPYLNNVIDRSIETLQKYDPKETKSLNLIDLMN